MDYAQRNVNLLSRIDRHAHPSAADLRKAAERCLAIAENFSKHRDELEREGFYTPDGRRARLAEALTKEVARDMANARATIDAAAKGVERLRGQIKPVQIDRTDPVAEMRRAEIRNYMRSLPNSERMAALLTPTDPQIVDAVLDAPPALSGVLPEHYETAAAAREERLHGPQLRAVAALQAVVDDAAAAATIARADLARVAGLDRGAFDKLVAPIEN